MRMLVTRPEPDGTETAGRLAALGLEPCIFPLLAFEALPASLPEPRGFAALALTSANALRALEDRGALAAYRGIRAFAIGERTAARARDYGFDDVVTAGGTLGDLASRLAQARLSGPVFYPAAREPSADLARSLAPHGVMVITAHVYGMTPVATLPDPVRADLASGAIGAALFYSRRTAATFVGLVGEAMDRAARERLGVLCLSEAVAEPLVAGRFVRIGLADYPSEEAMMSLALAFARDQGRHMRPEVTRN